MLSFARLSLLLHLPFIAAIDIFFNYLNLVLLLLCSYQVSFSFVSFLLQVSRCIIIFIPEGFKPLTIFERNPVKDVWRSPISVLISTFHCFQPPSLAFNWFCLNDYFLTSFFFFDIVTILNFEYPSDKNPTKTFFSNMYLQETNINAMSFGLE